MAVDEGLMFEKDSAEKVRELVKEGTFGFAVFQCNDLLATFEELKSKGVKFKKEPKREFYGYEALFIDDSGNWFSLTEKSSQP